MKKKKVLVEYTFRTLLEVSEDWDDFETEFYLNDGSSCASNRLDDLIKDYKDICVCSIFHGKYIQDANDEIIHSFEEVKNQTPFPLEREL